MSFVVENYTVNITETRIGVGQVTRQEVRTRWVEVPDVYEPPPPQTAAPTTLLSEDYLDGETNCLDLTGDRLAELEARGVDLSTVNVVFGAPLPGDENGAGHVWLTYLDASGQPRVWDSQAGEMSPEEHAAIASNYEVRDRANGAEVLAILNEDPNSPARARLIARAGLDGALALADGAPSWLSGLPVEFADAYAQFEPVLDPSDPNFEVMMLISTVPLPPSMGGATEATFADMVEGINNGTITRDAIRAQLEAQIARWEGYRDRGMYDYTGTFAEDVAVFFGGLFNGFHNPLGSLQSFSGEIVAGLERSLALLDSNDPALWAKALFHGQLVDGIASDFGNALVAQEGGQFMGNYYQNLRATGEILQLVSTYGLAALTGPFAPAVAGGVSAFWELGMDSSMQYAMTGEIDGERLLRNVAADATGGAFIGLTALAAPAIAARFATVFSGTTMSANAALWATRLSTGASVSAIQHVGANQLPAWIRDPEAMPSTPQDVLDFLGGLMVATATGAVPSPLDAFPGAMSSHPLMRAMLREGSQEVIQDLLQNAGNAVLAGEDPLVALTSTDAGLTFLTSALISSVTGGRGDFDSLIAQQRAEISASLEAAGVAPEVIAEFQARHELLAIAAQGGTTYTPRTTPFTEAEVAQLMTFFESGAIDPGVLNRWNNILRDMRLENPELAGIPEYQLLAMYGYSADGFRALNTALRDGDPAAIEQYRLYIDAVVLGLQSMPTFTGTVYRGERVDDPAARAAPYIEAFNNGTTVTEAAFISTSMGGVTSNYQGNVEFVIHSESGSNIENLTYFGTAEHEVLFPPGTEFDVLDIQIIDGKYYIYLQEVS